MLIPLFSFQKKIVFPNVKIDDFLIQAATDIVSLFTNPPTNMIPSLQVGDSTQNALLQLAEILNTTTFQPTQPKEKPQSLVQQANTSTTNSTPTSTMLHTLNQLTRVI